MSKQSPRCRAKKRDGTPCPTRPMPGQTVCWVHDPDLAEERAEGRKRGGVVRSTKAATLSPDAPDLSLRSVDDVVTALTDTFNAVRVGRMDVRVGNCLGVLAGVILKALEGAELERRLSAVEADQARTRRVR